MTYTTAIILNAVFAVLVVAVLARIVRFGVTSDHSEPSFAPATETTFLLEDLAA
jgi:hypothetical protein